MADITTRNTGQAARPWAGGVVLALLAGAGLYAGAAHTVAVDAQARFDHLARTGAQQLAGAVRSYADVVRGLAGLFQAHGGTVTRLEFHRYVAALGVAEHYPALESVNYAAYVDEAARDAFVAGVRADRSVDPAGHPGFAIRSGVHRPSYTVLTYLEPWLPEKAGVDLTGGAPAIAQTLARARDSGRMAASGKPVVVERPVRHLGLGLRMPVYRSVGAVPSDVEGRRAAYAGSVGIGFAGRPRGGGPLPGGDAPVALQLYAAADARAAGALRVNDADNLLYDGAGPAPAGGADVFDIVLPVRFDDNLWKARFVARRADLVGDAGRVFPWLAGAGGFGATLLVHALFLNFARSRRTAGDGRRLIDLVLDNADAHVYLKDRDGRYRYVNAKMAAACGLPADAIVGRRDRDVMPPAQADALWALDRPVLELGEKRAVQHAFAGADGAARQLWSLKVPVRCGDGNVDAVLSVATDVTAFHAPQAGAAALAGLTILLVEDDAFDRRVARELLEDAGAAVVGADDGAQALARLEERTVDCVLMDVEMPVMDGIEAMRRIRANPRLAGLKVIAMTAEAGIDDRARWRAAGMDECLAKPVAPETLAAAIARVLGRTGTQQWRRPDAPDAPGADTLLDLGVLSDALEGQPGGMRTFAFLFLDAARDGLHEIDRALAAQDPARAAAAAHRLKSAARTIGALGFADVCAALERQVGPGALDRARTLAARLRGLLPRLERDILAELGARRQDRPG